MIIEEFEGLPVNAHSLALKGTGDGLSNAMAITKPHIRKGDTVFLLIRAVAGAVKFVPDNDSDAWKSREQTLMAETIAIVDAEFAESRLLAQKAAEDRRKGIVPLPFPDQADKGDIVHTDENGVVLTPAEYAERVGAGLPVVDLIVTPAVVVFASGARSMWPDEFLAGSVRPVPGDVFADGEVVELLDATTGEVIELSRPSGSMEGGGSDELTTGTAGESSDAHAEELDDSPAADWEEPDPATAARLASADVDPVLVEFLAGGVAEVKMRVRQQLSLQVLRGALDVELRAEKSRAGIVSALEARIAELDD